MARQMITRYGMSEVIGLMAIGQQDQEVFLGRELVQRREVSEHTATRVDQEIRRILDEAHQRARGLLAEHRDLLEDIAQALLERESLDAPAIALLDAGEELPPLSALEENGDGDGDGDDGDPAEDSPAATDEDGAEDEADVTEPSADEESGDDQAASREVRTPAVRLGSEDPETGASG